MELGQLRSVQNATVLCSRPTLDTDYGVSPGLAGEPGDAVTIKSVKVSPDPPRPGQNLTIYAEGTVNNDIEVRRVSFSPSSSR